MSDIEKILREKKEDIDKIQVPDELENRLRNTLDKASYKKKKSHRWMAKAAALILAVTLIGYNVDTLAFYGRKIMGFDGVMNNTLKELNKNRRGQVIDKSYTFKNGIIVTLDGVMIDDNQLLTFYTIKNPKGNVEEVRLNIHSLQGKIKKYYQKGGMGNINKEKTEEKSSCEFEKPDDYDTKLKWKIDLFDEKGKIIEKGEIAFEIDKSKAMGHTLKKNLNKTIKTDRGNIKIKSIQVSPTSTYIEGETQDIVELGIDKIMGKGFRTRDINIKLIANGKEVKWQGGEIKTDMYGETFKEKYDTLPQDIKTLKIKLVSLEAYDKVYEKIKIDESVKNKSFNILGQNIEINEVHKDKEKTYITISTEEHVLLSCVNMIIDGTDVKLKDTSEGEKIKIEKGKIVNKRTLCFEDVGENMELEIGGITYNRIYNKEITVMKNQ